MSPPCINSTASNKYLNAPTVREALHIPSGLPNWTICRFVFCTRFDENLNSFFNYRGFSFFVLWECHADYLAMKLTNFTVFFCYSEVVGEGYKQLYTTMSPIVLKLIKVCARLFFAFHFISIHVLSVFSLKHYRGMVYNGDTDMACNFLGDQEFVENLGLPVSYSIQQYHTNDTIPYHTIPYHTIPG